MPVVQFDIRWPDGVTESCLSPSTIIEHHLAEGRSYAVADFVAACRAGLRAASERVRQRYGGSGCSQAMAQLARIEAQARTFPAQAAVTVDRIRQRT